MKVASTIIKVPKNFRGNFHNIADKCINFKWRKDVRGGEVVFSASPIIIVFRKISLTSLHYKYAADPLELGS